MLESLHVQLNTEHFGFKFSEMNYKLVNFSLGIALYQMILFRFQEIKMCQFCSSYCSISKQGIAEKCSAYKCTLTFRESYFDTGIAIKQRYFMSGSLYCFNWIRVPFLIKQWELHHSLLHMAYEPDTRMNNQSLTLEN